MSKIAEIQNRLKEISELLQINDKKSKRKVVSKLKEISNISTTLAFTLEINKSTNK